MGVGALSFRIYKRNVVVKAAAKWWGQWAAHIAAAWVLFVLGQLHHTNLHLPVLGCFWQHGAPAGPLVGPLVCHGC